MGTETSRETSTQSLLSPPTLPPPLLSSSSPPPPLTHIPSGTAPPSSSAIINRAREMLSRDFHRLQPLEVAQCRQTLKDATLPRLKHVDYEWRRWSHHLTTFFPEDPPFSEKSVRFMAPINSSPPLDVLLSSTKNSDSTISYWVQYPLNMWYLRRSILHLMNVTVTPANLYDLDENYGALLLQLENMILHEQVNCEQIDPLFFEVALRCLLLRNYRPEIMSHQNVSDHKNQISSNATD